MMSIVQWIQGNWVLVTAAILAGIRFLECIAELTPSEKDDNLIIKLKNILRNFFQFDFGPDA